MRQAPGAHRRMQLNGLERRRKKFIQKPPPKQNGILYKKLCKNSGGFSSRGLRDIAHERHGGRFYREMVARMSTPAEVEPICRLLGTIIHVLRSVHIGEPMFTHDT